MSLGSLETLLFSRDQLNPEALLAAGAGDPWCVAFSGGADSLALLVTLCQLWPAQREKITALHFNHRLRGAESDGDEAFCREVAGSLGVAFVAGAWSSPEPDAGESSAREARHSFFAEQLRSTGAKRLWTGHHADDVAETLLMRLTRGAGTQGLSAPRPVQSHLDGVLYLRPLLDLRRASLEDALKNAGWSWRMDSSNTGRDFFRNRVRLDVMPAWIQASGRDAVQGAALSRTLLDEDAAALNHWLDHLLRGADFSGSRLNLAPLRDHPKALWRRALHRWPAAQGLSRQGFDALLETAMAGEGVANLADGCVEIEAFVLQVRTTAVAPSWAHVSLAPGLKVALPCGGSLGMADVVYNPELRQAIFSGKVDQETQAYFAGPLEGLSARSVRPGDRYQPLGMPEPVKVQDLFVNRKIPREARGLLPIVCDRLGEIVWIPGFGPSERHRVTASSVHGGYLTYSTGTSTVCP